MEYYMQHLATISTDIPGIATTGASKVYTVDCLFWENSSYGKCQLVHAKVNYSYMSS